eukprot:262849_1
MPIRDFLKNLLDRIVGTYKVFEDDTNIENKSQEMDNEMDNDMNIERPNLPLMTVGNEQAENLFKDYDIDNRDIIRKLITERTRERQLPIGMNEDLHALKLLMGSKDRDHNPKSDGILVSDKKGLAYFRIFNGYNYNARPEYVEFGDVYGKILIAQKKLNWTYFVAQGWE